MPGVRGWAMPGQQRVQVREKRRVGAAGKAQEICPINGFDGPRPGRDLPQKRHCRLGSGPGRRGRAIGRREWTTKRSSEATEC